MVSVIDGIQNMRNGLVPDMLGAERQIEKNLKEYLLYQDYYFSLGGGSNTTKDILLMRCLLLLNLLPYKNIFRPSIFFCNFTGTNFSSFTFRFIYSKYPNASQQYRHMRIIQSSRALTIFALPIPSYF